jgi:hypothetical protein
MPTVKVVQVHLNGGATISALAEDVERQLVLKESKFWSLHEYRKTGDPIRVNPAHIVMIEPATEQSA